MLKQKKNRKLQLLRFYSVSLETENISHTKSGNPVRKSSVRQGSIGNQHKEGNTKNKQREQ